MATTRLARLADLEAITKIYNDAVLTSTATFDLEPKSREEQLKWFESHDHRYPVIVAEWSGQVVGWACLSEWSPRRAYAITAEITSYVGKEFRGRGIGRELIGAIIAEADRIGYHSLIARIVAGNDVSVHLNECFGFRHVGVLRQVGRKFGQLLDVLIYQRIQDSGR